MSYCKGLEFSSQHLHQETPNTVTPVLETPEASDLQETHMHVTSPTHRCTHIHRTKSNKNKEEKKRRHEEEDRRLGADVIEQRV